jgi:anti-sigma-K factor RskA
MNINDYISSGILELYVAGALSAKENAEVHALLQQHPKLLQEVLEIEAAVVKLTAATASGNSKQDFTVIKQRLENLSKIPVTPLNQTKYKWATFSGWAAAIILAAGLLWSVSQNNQLQTRMEMVRAKNSMLELQIENSKYNLNEANALVKILKDDAIIRIPLTGQGKYTNTYAKVYWDKAQQRIFLDAEGLPTPPKGKVYQVWSLALNPLVPTSLGTLDNFSSDSNKIFEIDNLNPSEAFGITLEPKGGSATPTMEQLYTLGALSSS